jgi:hypothetical protein
MHILIYSRLGVRTSKLPAIIRDTLIQIELTVLVPPMTVTTLVGIQESIVPDMPVVTSIAEISGGLDGGDGSEGEESGTSDVHLMFLPWALWRG